VPVVSCGRLRGPRSYASREEALTRRRRSARSSASWIATRIDASRRAAVRSFWVKAVPGSLARSAPIDAEAHKRADMLNVGHCFAVQAVRSLPRRTRIGMPTTATRGRTSVWTHTTIFLRSDHALWNRRERAESQQQENQAIMGSILQESGGSQSIHASRSRMVRFTS
jgi:hypothetical protein